MELQHQHSKYVFHNLIKWFTVFFFLVLEFRNKSFFGISRHVLSQYNGYKINECETGEKQFLDQTAIYSEMMLNFIISVSVLSAALSAK